MTDVAYCGDPALVEVFPGAPVALRRLKAAGYALILVTNQSGLGRGYFSEADYAAVHAEFQRQLGPDLLDAAYHCGDAPEAATERRKPGAGMVMEAAAAHALDLSRSFLIGDSPVDLACGRRAGLAGVVLVRTGRDPAAAARSQPDFLADDLAAATNWILARLEGHAPSCPPLGEALEGLAPSCPPRGQTPARGHDGACPSNQTGESTSR
jgi:D-glycero-D-manno-heptose 1,7-bisphosphate phosphatase